MQKDQPRPGAALIDREPAAIRTLVETALFAVAAARGVKAPRTRAEQIDHLCDALIAKPEARHKAILAEMIAAETEPGAVFHDLLPAAARRLGELWLHDKASFVEVTLGAGRLQAALRQGQGLAGGPVEPTTIPLGQDILIAVPKFEAHSLGAFVVADQFRQAGLWVHLSIGAEVPELLALLRNRSFALIGFSIATERSAARLADVIAELRRGLSDCPKIVIGGRAVDERAARADSIGADFAVSSVEDAIAKCGLLPAPQTMQHGKQRDQ